MTATVGPYTLLQVTLHRDSLNTAWGFRLQGGKDFGKPLTIQRVFTGSPAEGELQRGDLIVAIDGYDTSALIHKQAQDLIKRSGGTLSIAVQRGQSGRTPPQSPIKQPSILFQQPKAPTHTPVSPTRQSLYSPPPAPMPQPRYQKFRPAPAAPVSPPPFINPSVYYPPKPQQHHEQQRSLQQMQPQFETMHVSAPAPAPAQYYAPPPFAGGPPPEDDVDYSFMEMPVSARKKAFMNKEQAVPQPRRTGRRPVIRTNQAADFTGWTPGHEANKPSPRRQYEPAHLPEPPINRKQPPPVPAKPQHHHAAPPAQAEHDEGDYAPAWRGTLKTGASVGRPWEVKPAAGGGGGSAPAPQFKAVSFSPHPQAVSQPYSPASAGPHHHAAPPAGGAQGSRVETVQGNKQGPTAAHLQFNSPMKLYSTDNVRASMDGQLRGTGAEGTMQVAGGGPSAEPDYTQSPVYKLLHEDPNRHEHPDVKQSRSFQTLSHVVSDEGGVDAVSDF